MNKNPIKVDIFCQIIDNFGDIGVTWRLAQQLSSAYQYAVRLWIDDIASASLLIPQLSEYRQQPSQLNQHHVSIAGVQIQYWQAHQPISASPSEVVIEAFACQLPEDFQREMVANTRVWINLEYLSAEPWVKQFHGLSSIQNSNGLSKTFFFPGFSEDTGGLLRENDLLNNRDRWRQDNNFSNHLDTDTYHISLFTYTHAPVQALLQALSQLPYAIHCHIPLVTIQDHLTQFFGQSIQAGKSYQVGNLTAHILPFLSQQQYDQLLWRCHLNFVRGEDSLVRAIWSGSPLIWLPYQQAEKVHLDKLTAFLDVYWQGNGNAIAALNWEFANGLIDANRLFKMLGELKQLSKLSELNAQQLSLQADLASQINQLISRTNQ